MAGWPLSWSREKLKAVGWADGVTDKRGPSAELVGSRFIKMPGLSLRACPAARTGGNDDGKAKGEKQDKAAWMGRGRGSIADRKRGG